MPSQFAIFLYTSARKAFSLPLSLCPSLAAKEERKELQMEASKRRQKREKERTKFFIDHNSSTSS
jgi:hypothetical protein